MSHPVRDPETLRASRRVHPKSQAGTSGSRLRQGPERVLGHLHRWLHAPDRSICAAGSVGWRRHRRRSVMLSGASGRRSRRSICRSCRPQRDSVGRRHSAYIRARYVGIVRGGCAAMAFAASQGPRRSDVHRREQACENVAVAASTDGWYPRSFVLTDIVGSVSLWERDAALMAQAVATPRRHHWSRGRRRRRGVSAKQGRGRFDLLGVRSSRRGGRGSGRHPGGGWRRAVAGRRLPLRVRAGVHTGDAEPRDGDWYGPAVNRAARLRALADGGQTLVSGVTAGLVADQLPNGVRLLYRGRRVLRGIERPEEVWELVAADDPRLATPESSEGGGLPLRDDPFVGRRADLETARRAGRGRTAGHPHRAWRERQDPVGDGGWRGTPHGEARWCGWPNWRRCGTAGSSPRPLPQRSGSRPGPIRSTACWRNPRRWPGCWCSTTANTCSSACAALDRGLLAAAPELRVLATSREPLGLAGERVWPVRPLEVPDESLRDRDQLARVESVQLLLDRARAVRPDLEVGDDDVAAVVRICRALDGMPLAIELAAGRLRSLSFADLAERLGDQLKVLARHRSAGRDDARHRTLRMTLDWSYDLLTDEQRTLARRLSVFAGGFRLDAVEAVCGGDLDVLDGIDELVAKSLVTFDGATARYRLLEPLRQYLAERLDEAGATEIDPTGARRVGGGPVRPARHPAARGPEGPQPPARRGERQHRTRSALGARPRPCAWPFGSSVRSASTGSSTTRQAAAAGVTR